MLYQILVFTIHGRIKKVHTTTVNLKYQLQHGMINLNYEMNHILYQIFKIILSIFHKKHEEKIDNPSLRIYVNKIENRITIKIKTGYYLELLVPETMKLVGSNENKITKDKNGENVPHLRFTEVLLAQCNIADMIIINKTQEFCINLSLINHFVNY